MALSKPRLIDLHRIADPRGNLTVVSEADGLPFEPVRCYWINDVPGGCQRQGHAYFTSAEVIVPLAGSFTVTTGSPGSADTSDFLLTRPDRGLYIPPMTWRELHSFTVNAVALVISSTLYDETDYIRSAEQFNSLSATSDEI